MQAVSCYFSEKSGLAHGFVRLVATQIEDLERSRVPQADEFELRQARISEHEQID